MNHFTISNRILMAYSVSAAAFLLNKKADAQISYTDVDPDIFVDVNVFEQAAIPIDLNNDGTTDMNINMDGFTDSGGKIYYIILHGNGDWGVDCTYFFYHLIQGLSYGEHITGRRGRWIKGSGIMQYNYLGEFNGAGDRYFAVRYKKDSTSYYGWVRVNIDYHSDQVTLKDYAVNTEPNAPLHAGQTLPCADNFEDNGSFAAASRIEQGYKYYALISSETDVDFYKFKPDKPNVRITLENLPQNYNLILYNEAHEAIAKSTNSGTINDTVVYNNLPSGHYLIKVYGKNGSFDASNCYALKIETSDSPFRMAESHADTANESLVLFPNPADGMFTLLLNLPDQENSDAKIEVINLLGQTIVSENVQLENGKLQREINLNDAAAGMYLVKVTINNRVYTAQINLNK